MREYPVVETRAKDVQDLGVATSPRLAGESETGASVVPALRIAAAHAGPAAKTYGSAPRTRRSARHLIVRSTAESDHAPPWDRIPITSA